MKLRMFVALAAVVALIAVGSASAAPSGSPLEFRVTFDAGLRADPATGRVFVIVSAPDDPDPRFNVYVGGGVPAWGRDVTDVAPGTEMVVDASPEVYGYPFASIDQLPEGDYTVQAFLNVYTTFTRSDGSVVELHMPCGDGGYFFDSPGNLYSTPVQVHLSPTAGTVDLALDTSIVPSEPVPDGGTCQQGNPSDSRSVKHPKIQSDLLSEFWGTPIFIGADVLLPAGYDKPENADTHYPVVYLQGHYPSGNPFGFSQGGGNRFSDWWLSKAAPRVIVVQFRHENPFFDDSYAVNSANLGPYGDAIVTELIPTLERSFRMVPKAWARTLTGGSTGGWEALAQQIFYPSFYGGSWGLCPDSLSFQWHQLVNIYEYDNAYFSLYDWEQVPRPSARTVPGDTLWTMEEENHFELAMGTHGRSQLGQWDVWQAVFGPQGADGYPAPVWDKATGEIDHAVAERWKPMDLSMYIADRWSQIGPKLAGKLRIYVGDDDTFFLNNGVEAMQSVLEGLKHPKAAALVAYGSNAPHCWGPWGAKLVQLMADAMASNAPANADLSWYRTRAAVADAPVARFGSLEPYGRRGLGLQNDPPGAGRGV